MHCQTLDDYFQTYGAELQRQVVEDLRPLHDPAQDEPLPVALKRQLFPPQAHVVSSLAKAWETKSGLFLCGEMGTGKTICGMAAAHMHARGEPYRALVFCPGQLTGKWKRELQETIPGVTVKIIRKWTDLVPLRPDRGGASQHASVSASASGPAGPEWYIIARDRAKLGAKWTGSYVTSSLDVTYHIDDQTGQARLAHNGLIRCPGCGQVLKEGKQEKLLTPAALDKKKRWCQAQVETPDDRLRDCNAPLWTYTHDIKRWEPALFIKRYFPGFFDYLILDEVHEEKSATSAQANAAGSLIAASKRTLALTGTLIGGYAEHIRPLLFRMAPRRVVQEGFAWKEVMPFSQKYGRIEIRVTEKDSPGDANAQSRGSSTTTSKYIRPGIMPTLLHHLLDCTVFLSLHELSDNLPVLREEVVPVPLTQSQHGHYKRLENTLTNTVKEMRGDRRLLGPMLNALLYWADYPYDWTTIGYYDRDQETGVKLRFHEVITPHSYEHRDTVWPKEEELLRIVRQERSEGRQCWVYVQMTDKYDVLQRLTDLLRRNGINATAMRSNVKMADREDWIHQHAKDADVILSHPRLVETGLDLFDKGGNHNFSTLIWYETGYNLFTLRQASRRSWRIGQQLPCRIYYLYYEGTMQERAMGLMGKKLAASHALEGKFSSEGLTAMTEGDDGSMEMQLAKDLADQITVENARRIWSPVVEASPAESKPAPQLKPTVSAPQSAEPTEAKIEPAKPSANQRIAALKTRLNRLKQLAGAA